VAAEMVAQTAAIILVLLVQPTLVAAVVVVIMYRLMRLVVLVVQALSFSVTSHRKHPRQVSLLAVEL
jgi:hypothetical protein